MKAIGQAHGPTPLALVHLQDDGGFPRRMFAGRLDEEEIGTHVGNADGFAVDNQLHLHLGRMRAVTLLGNHERNIAA